MLIQTLHFICGILFCLIVPSTIGKSLFKLENTFLNHTFGWCVLSLFLYVALLFGIASQTFITTLCYGLSLVAVFINKPLLSLKKFNPINFYKELTALEKLLLLSLSLCVMIRLLRVAIPSLNWDSINNHFLLLSERLVSGDLSPLMHVPSDKRVPQFAQCYKLWTFALDSTGRLLILNQAFILYWSAFEAFKLMHSKINRTQIFLFLGIIFSITDIAVHTFNAGDEAFLALCLVAILSVFKLDKTFKNACLFAFLCAFFLSTKLTALFWLPYFGITALVIYRNLKLKIILPLCVLVVVTIVGYSREYLIYGMVYPFTRWTNLLEFEPTGVLFQSSFISEQRELLGISLDHNNQTIGSSWLAKFLGNFKTLLFIGIGPFLFWGLLACFQRKNFLSFEQVKVILLPLSALLISFGMWSFTEPALYRYHIPSWIVLTALFAGLFLMNENKVWKKFITTSLILLLLFTSSLEFKVHILRFKSGFFLSSKDFYTQHAPEGKLIELIHQNVPSNENLFYIGNSCGLVKRPGTWFAQIGNEVGWREVDQLKAFLDHLGIRFWAVSHQTSRIDPIYKALTSYLIQHHQLKVYAENEQGKIYTFVKN